jgi:anti-sigma factor RsiW
MTTSTTTSCQDYQADLVGYHFAVLSADARRALEAHLVACATCVGAYVAIKRDLEIADDGPRPSEASRTRLRASMAAELRKRPRAWSWWERPFAFTFATAATVLAMVAVTQLYTHEANPPHAFEDTALIRR